jgi:hypothetical protein
MAAGVAAMGSIKGSATAQAASGREYYQMRVYRGVPDDKATLLRDYLRDAAIPAWNRLGVKPVGVFEPIDEEVKDVYVMLVASSLETVATATSRLLDDPKYAKAAEAFLSVPKKEPAYTALESSLMLAFEEMPKVVAPKKQDTRVYELRTYQSHNTLKARKKVEMFNQGGEIAVFLDAGLLPVFFGQTLAGPAMPNLTYMVSSENMEAHDANWKAFQGHPGWTALKGVAEYKDSVSKITKVYLKAAPFSQI